jgi:dihydrofolate reductase
MDRNRVIGHNNDIPWYLPSDLKFFKRITMGKPIIMGRKTHLSIGRVLPGRNNIVVTGNLSFQAQDCTVVHSLESAIAAAGPAEEALIIGGGSLYQQALPIADRLYLTEIDAEFDGNTYFPEFDPGPWRELSREIIPRDRDNEFAYTRRLLERA